MEHTIYVVVVEGRLVGYVAYYRRRQAENAAALARQVEAFGHNPRAVEVRVMSIR